MSQDDKKIIQKLAKTVSVLSSEKCEYIISLAEDAISAAESVLRDGARSARQDSA